MIVEQKVESKFEPVQVTFETKDELLKFYVMCNFTPINEALEMDWWNKFDDINIKGYNKYHEKLSAILK